MPTFETALRGLQRRLATLLIVRAALAFLAIWFFTWGTGVLVLRVAAHVPAAQLLWGLAAVPLVLAAAVVCALRELPGRTVLGAVVDGAGGCGGLLMAAEERPLGDWNRSLPSLAPITLRWHSGRTFTVFGSAVVFVLVALLFPQSAISQTSPRALEIGKEIDTLTAQVHLLKEEQILDEARAEALKEKLHKLKEEARGSSPVKTLEALDHVHSLVTKAARKAGEDSIPKAEQMGRTEALAEALRKKGDALEPQVRAEAMAELAALAAKAAEENKTLDQELDPETRKALEAGRLTPEQMKKLTDALKGARHDLRAQLEKLRDAELIDPDLLKECDLAGDYDCDALADILEKLGGTKPVADLVRDCAGERPGRGGVTEGGGRTPITFGDESTPDGAKFKEKSLPPGTVAALKQSQVVGLSRAAPGAEKGGKSDGPGGLAQATAGGGSAQTQVILPRHRAAVERYFDRPAGTSKGPALSPTR